MQELVVAKGDLIETKTVHLALLCDGRSNVGEKPEVAHFIVLIGCSIQSLINLHSWGNSCGMGCLFGLWT